MDASPDCEGDPPQAVKRLKALDANTYSRPAVKAVRQPRRVHEHLMLELPRTWQSSSNSISQQSS